MRTPSLPPRGAYGRALLSGLLLCLAISPPAAATPAAAPTAEEASRRLPAKVRGLLERLELPPLAPGVQYILVVGEERLTLDRAGIEQLHAVNRRLTSSFQLRDFTIQGVDCGADLCWLRYRYRFAARVGASESSGVSENQELWVREGDQLRLALGIARQ